MTPVFQRQYPPRDGEKLPPGQYGDCFRAALASLLDLRLTDVPHFNELARGEGESFWRLVNKFMAQRGQALVLVQGFDFGHFTRAGMADVFHLILGYCRDGDGHTLVGLNGKIVFDPNPTHPALVTNPRDYVFGLVVHAANKVHRTEPAP